MPRSRFKATLSDSRTRARAAQYLRMSTGHQKCSLETQAAAIAEYADRLGFTIVRTYQISPIIPST